MSADGTRRASVVLPTLNEGDMLTMTVESVLAGSARDTEVIIVDDGSTDGSADRWRAGGHPQVQVVQGGHLGVAGARNLGARHATGHVLVFLDAHCRVDPGWLTPLVAALDDPSVAIAAPAMCPLGERSPAGCGMSWTGPRLETAWFPSDGLTEPFEIPIAPGGCQAFRRWTFHWLGGFHEGFERWGFEDVEISLRAWRYGGRVLGVPSVLVEHWFREARGFDVTHRQVARNMVRLAMMHLPPVAIRRSLAAWAPFPSLPELIEENLAAGVQAARHDIEARSVRDDRWLTHVLFDGCGLT